MAETVASEAPASPVEASDEAVAAAMETAAAGAEEPEFVPYSVRHPLIEPKCIAERGKAAGGDKFMRKDQDAKKKKKSTEEEGKTNVTGKALELFNGIDRLENDLKTKLRIEPPPAPAERRSGIRGRMGGRDRGRGGAATTR